MVEATSNYDDVRMYGMDADREAELLDKQKECTFIWTTKAITYDGDKMADATRKFLESRQA